MGGSSGGKRIGGAVAVSLLLALGSLASPAQGFFSQAQYIFTNDGGVGEMTRGDFNGDGDSDLALIGGGKLVIMTSLDGHGLEPAATLQVPGGFAAVGDFNGDQDPDIALASRASDSVSILLGEPGFAFSAPSSIAVAPDPSAIAIGDFNGDGDPDLVTSNSDFFVHVSDPGWWAGRQLLGGDDDGGRRRVPWGRGGGLQR